MGRNRFALESKAGDLIKKWGCQMPAIWQQVHTHAYAARINLRREAAGQGGVLTEPNVSSSGSVSRCSITGTRAECNMRMLENMQPETRSKKAAEKEKNQNKN